MVSLLHSCLISEVPSCVLSSEYTMKENLIRDEPRQWGGQETRRCLKQFNSLLMDLMHQGESATAGTVNQSHAMSNLRLSCVQATFQISPLPMYLYMSARQSAAAISNLNSLPLKLWQPAWAGVDMKEDCTTPDWTLSYLLTERPEKKVCRRKFPSQTRLLSEFRNYYHYSLTLLLCSPFIICFCVLVLCMDS